LSQRLYTKSVLKASELLIWRAKANVGRGPAGCAA